MIIGTVFIYQFVDPDLMVEKEGQQIKGVLILKRVLRHLFADQKRTAFKSHFDMYFNPLIIEFFSYGSGSRKRYTLRLL